VSCRSPARARIERSLYWPSFHPPLSSSSLLRHTHFRQSHPLCGKTTPQTGNVTRKRRTPQRGRECGRRFGTLPLGLTAPPPPTHPAVTTGSVEDVVDPNLRRTDLVEEEDHVVSYRMGKILGPTYSTACRANATRKHPNNSGQSSRAFHTSRSFPNPALGIS